MYYITKLLNGKWAVECRVQDGTERWEETTRKKAVHSLISTARISNGTYIRVDDIIFREQKKSEHVSGEEKKLLSEIESGYKVVLPHDHFLLKYRITEEEVKMIVYIREGRLRLSAS